MTTTAHYIDFRHLREAYHEVKAFIESEIGVEVTTLDDKLYNDFGCAGDDAYELLEKFVSKYKLDAAGFDFLKHFNSEHELFGSGGALLTLLSLPFTLLFWLIKILSFGKIELNNTELNTSWQRETLDLTFGDMLTWYLTGKYCIRKDIKVLLKSAA